MHRPWHHVYMCTFYTDYSDTKTQATTNIYDAYALYVYCSVKENPAYEAHHLLKDSCYGYWTVHYNTLLAINR